MGRFDGRTRKGSIARASFAAMIFALGGAAAHAQTPAAPEASAAPVDQTSDPFATAEAPPAPETAPQPAAPELTLSDAIANGKVILEARLRAEFVEQANIANEASAYTLRTRLGWETAAWNGFTGLIEFENVTQLSDEDYNSGINGKTSFPTVSDPEGTEINRAQISWSPSPMFQAVLGRQRIMLDDQRFIGNVGWRQDEQTFDAARADLALGKFKATYIYSNYVNRILADERDWDGEINLLNASYAFADPLKLTGFAYLTDIETAGATGNSNQTYGARATGKLWAGLVGVSYALTYAQQEDYGSNTANFDLDYAGAEVSAQFDIYTARLAYESLEGNGARGFTTPLATLHAFQGWGDLFLTTPTNGIEDLNLSLNVRPRFRRDHFFNIDLTARYHDFDFERTGLDIGDEFDFQAQAALTPRLSIVVKYADFDADVTSTYFDTTKTWIGLEFRL